MKEKKKKTSYLNNFGTKGVVLISQDRGKKRGGKKSMCSANVSVKELSTGNFIFLSTNKDHLNTEHACSTHMQSRGVWQELSIFSKDKIGRQLWVLGSDNYIPCNTENVSSYLLANV